METRLPSPALIVLVGPSGAGKSTWADASFDRSEIVSSDELRARVGAGPADMTASAAAFEILNRIVEERMKRRLTTVIDTLGLDAASRSAWVSLAHRYDVAAHAVIFTTPLDLCLERNRQRTDPLPEQAIRGQHKEMRDVAAGLGDEGFDGIIRDETVRVVPPQMVEVPEAQPEELSAPEAGHKFGLLLSRFDWKDHDLVERLGVLSRAAEESGFTDIWLMDHFRQIPQVGRAWEDIPEVYSTLSYLAARTSTIRLGALVTGITHRPPMVLGRAIATLDVLSGGRAICGLGVGWDEDEHRSYGIQMPSLSERYELLSESIDALRLLWGKGTPDFAGKHLVASNLACYPRPVQDPIPILVGGSGEKKTLRLVAEKADACNLFGPPERVAHKVEVLRSHCASLARNPDEIDVSHLVNVMAAGDNDSLRARVSNQKDRRQSYEQFAARNNAGLTDDVVRLIQRYQEAGANHTIIAIPDVHIDGAIEEFAAVIDRVG